MNVKFQNLSPLSFRGLDQEIRDTIDRINVNGVYLNGVETGYFEIEFAEYIGMDNHCVAVGNGFDAILLSLMAAEVYTGDVLVPANAPMPVWKAVTMAGVGNSLHPIAVKPNVDTFNITLDEIKKKVTRQTKAIIVVHMFGCPVDEIEEIKSFCEKRRLILIEDCSQAHGAEYPDQIKAGNFGDYSVFSFYPTKNLGAMGDAGAIITKSASKASLLRVMRRFGGETNSGLTSRMDEIQAAILRVKLRHLDDWNLLRKDYANFYIGALREIPGISLPKWRFGHVWHQFVIKVKNRMFLERNLFEFGIETMIHYPKFPPQSTFYEIEGERDSNEMQTVGYLSRSSLSLPIAPHLTWDEVKYIAKKIKEISQMEGYKVL